jgi:hypothetical protein
VRAPGRGAPPRRGWGAFGELACTNNEADLDPVERKVFRAFGRAQARTNLPIFTHNNYSTGENVPMDMAVRQLDALEAGGANPKSIALGHVCCLFDPMVDRPQESGRAAARSSRSSRVTRQQQWVVGREAHRHAEGAARRRARCRTSALLRVHRPRATPASARSTAIRAACTGARAGPAYARPAGCCSCRSSEGRHSAEVVRRITQDNPRRFLTFVSEEQLATARWKRRLQVSFSGSSSGHAVAGAS